MQTNIAQLFIGILAFSWSAALHSQQPGADIELNLKNLNQWRNHILPSQDELDFMKIPWRTTFKAGLVDANRLQRPVLLWTMNGHPLGCT
jgi:hypothetical protein